MCSGWWTVDLRQSYNLLLSKVTPGDAPMMGGAAKLSAILEVADSLMS
jgi:hypothetical protein